jgi:DNA-binding XRE family transcriptional regulator
MDIIHDMDYLSIVIPYELKYSCESMKKNKISVWLMRKYLGWQQSMGELKSQAEFAKYLGFNPSTLSMWMTGKQDPDLHSADLLAHKLGPVSCGSNPGLLAGSWQYAISAALSGSPVPSSSHWAAG